jgi:hypothetical protein
MATYTAKQLTQAKEYSEVIQRCWENEEFKQELISNPASLENHFDFKVPAGKKVEVLDRSSGGTVTGSDLEPNTIYFVIPEQVDIDSMELSDAQLELVAGGGTPATTVTIASTLPCGIVIGGGLLFGFIMMQI